MMALTHIDCFSGPGGICTGFHAAGIRTLVAIEYIKSCVDTYSANHPEVHVIHSDIRDVTAEQLLPYIPADGVDIVSSGMPCETFSTAGNTSRSFYDERQFLFREGLRIAKIAKAKMVLFENVPAIITKTVEKDKTERIIDVLKRELVAAGYENYIEVVLNAANYGVPQRRNRFFILATRLKGLKLSEPMPTQKKEVTVAEAFAELPNVVPNTKEEGRTYTGEASAFSTLMRDREFWRLGQDTNSVITYQTPMKHRACTLERFALLHQGESLKNLFERYMGNEREALQAQRVLPKKMFIKRNYRLRSDEASPTVTSHCLDEFVHPIYDRALTVRECARLQSFPDCYNFAGGPFLVPHIDRTVQDKYEQIGDAVPPLLAYAWGTQIIKILEGNAMTMSDIRDYCGQIYEDTYLSEKQRMESEILAGSRRGLIPATKTVEIETAAQKEAIKNATIAGIQRFPDVEAALIWKTVYETHVHRKSGIHDADTIAKVISADQSWKKSSGHAFEEMIKILASAALRDDNIDILLQRDLNILIKAHELDNEPRDISWLKEQIKASVFDLYAVVRTQSGKRFCYGCIQSKTSVRDRVTRDREPSMQAMRSFFWSTIIVLDGDFLKLPKFISMVNGGTVEHPENGWHGMYVFSDQYSQDRIYPIDLGFQTFRKHAVKAAQYWLAQRQWFNEHWRADTD